jgi:hypothetical protein
MRTWFQLLKLKCDEPLSDFAFKFNLRRYTMGISANTRYQIVNGVERVLYSMMPQAAARSASVGVRLCNNLLGARLWIVMTVMTGLA